MQDIAQRRDKVEKEDRKPGNGSYLLTNTQGALIVCQACL
jgi:hypothetical protein